MQFDDDPDEGGNWGNRPDARMKRQEAYEQLQRQQQRQQKRRKP